jgi:hypothetical protein
LGLLILRPVKQAYQYDLFFKPILLGCRFKEQKLGDKYKQKCLLFDNQDFSLSNSVLPTNSSLGRDNAKAYPFLNMKQNFNRLIAQCLGFG